ncbi:MAG: hypothetical protein WC393_00020 [Candidatus Nanoarchaeia archaeon]|jgi:hypothetical protein
MTLDAKLAQLQAQDSEWTPKELLDDAINKLNLPPQDILFIAADYINYNIKTRNAKYNEKTELLDMNNYKPVNYDKVEWTYHKLNLSPMNKSKLDFQIFTYAVTSEKLLREYYYKTNMGRDEGIHKKLAEKMNNPKEWSHQKLAIALARDFCFDRPNGKSFQLSNLDAPEYFRNLEKQIKKGASSEVIINDLLENLSKYYVFDAWQSW